VGFTEISGAIAQLGERLLCTQEVSGSIPLSSTINAQVDDHFRIHSRMYCEVLLFNNPEQAENLKERLFYRSRSESLNFSRR
jgi:hypothetical protein